MADTNNRRPISNRAWWTAVLYVAAAAMFVRFYDLPLKPLHHDEGVNTLFLTTLIRDHAYRYDPANYHGPTLYYLGWVSAAVLGLTDVAIRAVTAATGLAAVLLMLGLRREIGSVGALVATASLALSPGAVYFSRYFIHEMPLVCFTVAAVVAAAWWLRTGRQLYLLLASASAGLVFATKETALISAVVLAGAVVATPILAAIRRGRLRHALDAFWELRRRHVAGPLLTASAVFVIVNLMFYTSFFSNWQGAVDAVKSFAIWTHTGTSAHTRPWHAYLGWLLAEELPILVLGFAGAAMALWRADNRFAIFAALWAVGTLTAYSVIPYKTPWLVLNAIAPFAIVIGYLGELVWEQRNVAARAAAIAAAVGAAAASGYQAFLLNFVEYDNGRHPYVYVHTSREVFDLVREIDRVEALNPNATIAVTSRDHFPLSWYLRGYRAGYYGRPAITNDPIVIGSEEQEAALDASLGQRYTKAGSYMLRPGVQLLLYLGKDLKRPTTQPSSE